jgi:hypothetical protein
MTSGKTDQSLVPSNNIYQGGMSVMGSNNLSQTLSVSGNLGIKEGGTTPTYYTIFQGGDQSGDITYTLPTTSINGALINTGGVLSWSTNEMSLFTDAGAFTYLINTTDNLTIGGTTDPGEKLEVVGNIISKGTAWTVRTSAADNSWQSVTYGNGTFVAIAYTGTGNRIMTSPDGINWTIRTSVADYSWSSVTYGNGLFVAVSMNAITNGVMTSPDGITWTGRVSANANYWTSVTYGNGLFVAVANTGTGNRVMTSPDGMTWTARSNPVDNNWTSVTYGNGLFVAISSNGSGNRVMTSTDGITWSTQTSALDSAWNSVTYGNGLFVAVSISNGNVMTSPDGITWTLRTGINVQWNSVTYGGGLFVAVGYTTGTNGVMTSPDGIIWTSRTTIASNWLGVAYGNGTFVAVANSGTGNRVMTSGKTDQTITPITIRAVLGLEEYFTTREWEFMDTPADHGYSAGAIASGTVANTTAGDASHPGLLRYSSSTTTNSGYYVLSSPTAILLAGGEELEYVFAVPTTTSTTIRLGFTDSLNSVLPVDGTFISIVGTTLSSVSISNSVSTTAGTTYTITAATWYRAKIAINATGTRADYYLYNMAGTQLYTASVTTNIPIGAGRVTGQGFVATNVGVTAVPLLDMDYMRFTINRKLTR